MLFHILYQYICAVFSCMLLYIGLVSGDYFVINSYYLFVLIPLTTVRIMVPSRLYCHTANFYCGMICLIRESSAINYLLT